MISEVNCIYAGQKDKNNKYLAKYARDSFKHYYSNEKIMNEDC